MIRILPNMPMQIAPDARIAENASVIGQVRISSGASVWYGAVLRGDAGAITIGCRSAIEDNVTLHGHVVVGEDVVIGHNAIVHHCTIERGCLIGMGATVMSGAVIGEGSLVAAGCLVTENTIVPPHSLIRGVPGVVVGPLSGEQEAYVRGSAGAYLAFAQMQLPCWRELKTP